MSAVGYDVTVAIWMQHGRADLAQGPRLASPAPKRTWSQLVTPSRAGGQWINGMSGLRLNHPLEG